MNLTKADAERIFRKLDLQAKRSNNHVRGWLIVDGRRVLPLHYSHGRGNMPGHVPERFRNAMYLSRLEFERMVGCTMGRDEYIAMLRERRVF